MTDKNEMANFPKDAKFLGVPENWRTKLAILKAMDQGGLDRLKPKRKINHTEAITGALKENDLNNKD